MVAGHLQIKKGYYYMVLNLKDQFGKRKSKWIPTGISVNGTRNERQAEAMLLETRMNYKEPVFHVDEKHSVRMTADMLFADFMIAWLDIIKNSVEETTYAGYQSNVKKRIAPYFRKIGVTLECLTAMDIENFYLYCSNVLNLKATTIHRYHANMHKALKYAVRHELIAASPMDKVERPQSQKYIGSFYTVSEAEELFKAAKGDGIEFPILMAAFYGLRRSEIVGLRWQSIDFDSNTFTIEHTVVEFSSEEGKKIVEKDRAKNKSSCRTMPLVPEFRALLLEMKQKQEENRKLCGNCYVESDYIYVNALGERYNPNYITQHFPLLLEKNGLRKIRFHDLRHTCASLLLKNGVSMKDIQEWLGHSNFSTTANIYAHLEANAKQTAAEKMSQVLTIGTSFSDSEMKIAQ